MISRYSLIAALCGTVALAGYVWWLRAENAAQRAEIGRMERNIAALTMQAEQSALARDVERARAAREAERNAALSDRIHAISNGGIPDAPLHPDLANLVNGGSLQPGD